jgi:outer membrane receptor for ferrienterochelin and colicins
VPTGTLADVRLRWTLLLNLSAILAHTLAAQSPASRVIVHVTASPSDSGRPVEDATVSAGSYTAKTNARGEAIVRLEPGAYLTTVGRVGSIPDTLYLTIRSGRDTTVYVQLVPRPEVLDRVTVSATRTGGATANEPSRVEVIAGDEVQEQAAASPGAIGLLLTEARAVRIQPTAAGLGSAAIRLQGLRGQYTALLTDGLPLVGATTDGLDVAQIPPVDVGQVEVLPGVASALYGPAALGGVVDLISRRPTPETDVLLNQTTRNGTDAVVWTSDSLGSRWGYSLLASAHRQSERDESGDGWADVPGYDRAVVRPRLFWTGPNGSTALVTIGAAVENRTGGTLSGRLTPDDQSFPVDLDTRRFDGGAVTRLVLSDATTVTIRASGTEQLLTRNFGPLDERDRLTTGFGEASVTTTSLARHVGVAGLAVEGDGARVPGLAGFDYNYLTAGVFLQDTYTPVALVAITASARVDQHSVYGTFVSPRLAVLVHAGSDWTLRVSGGTGFTAPTAFTDETQDMSLRGLHPPSGLAAERGQSGAATLDGWLFRAGESTLELTATGFASAIAHPEVLRDTPDSAGLFSLVSLPRPTRTAGVDLIAHFRASEDVDLVAVYSSVSAREPDPTTSLPRDVPLTPRQTAGLDALIDVGGGTRFGAEAYYTGPQSLEFDPYRSTSRSYVLVGLLLAHSFGRAQLFADVENLGGVRQTQYEPLLLPAEEPGGRWTVDPWAPLAGRVLNIGIELRLGRGWRPVE